MSRYGYISIGCLDHLMLGVFINIIMTAIILVKKTCTLQYTFKVSTLFSVIY